MDNSILSNLVINKVTTASLMYNNVSDCPTYRANRGEWGIILKLEGKTIYTCNGKEYVSDALHPVILPKGITYHWKCVEAGRFAALGFQSDLTGDDIISVSLRENNTFLKYFSKIEKSRTLKNKMYSLENIRDAYSIILHLMESERERYTPSAKIEMLKPAIDRMVGGYAASGITNESLAKLCKISSVYFRKTFEKVYGTSPIAYLNALRIDRAKDMLRSDYDSISQVAENVGYNSIYHFSKMFKAHTGMSPTEYVKASRK